MVKLIKIETEKRLVRFTESSVIIFTRSSV